MVTAVPTLEDQVWAALETIEDPELPVTITDLGLIQAVRVDGAFVHVTMLPTFSACPAIGVMREDIRRRVGAIPGVDAVEVELSFSEPWTMARMTARARERLFSHGVSVERQGGAGKGVQCPFCGSTNTRLENPFGPTLCRAIYYCLDCKNPIERFRPPGGPADGETG
jgi:ring-1,2-phenylacetyl-CoA epoxidase subunit PaaD